MLLLLLLLHTRLEQVRRLQEDGAGESRDQARGEVDCCRRRSLASTLQCRNLIVFMLGCRTGQQGIWRGEEDILEDFWGRVLPSCGIS